MKNSGALDLARLACLTLTAALGAPACITGGSSAQPDGGAGGTGGGGMGGDNGDAAAAEAEPDAPPADEPPAGATCGAGEKTGPAGKTDGRKTKGGLGYNVRTPTDYDPTVGRPFIAVYAPASLSATDTESFMSGFTTGALARGYIVAYADHRSPSGTSVLNLGQEMVDAMVADYCIDTHRIYLTGHSDGGTISSGIGIYINPDLHPAAIGPSAPGLNAHDSDVPMQYPFSSIVVQSKDDATFPGKGKILATTLAKQAACDATPGAALPSGCIPWTGCKDGMEVQYCEGTGAHGVYQKKYAPAVLDFFDAHVRM